MNWLIWFGVKKSEIKVSLRDFSNIQLLICSNQASLAFLLMALYIEMSNIAESNHMLRYDIEYIKYFLISNVTRASSGIY